MNTFEHAMLGGNVALLLGCQRRHGWGLVATAGIAASLPDWDGASLAFGGAAFAEVHRAWGHNVLIASTTGMFAGTAGYLLFLSVRARCTAARFWPKHVAMQPGQPFSGTAWFTWMVVCVLASLSHLPLDVVYPGHAQLRDWPVKLLWPFSDRGWVFPLVPWGEIGTTLIFIAEMFALARWPQYARSLALVAVLALHLYIGIWWLFGGMGGGV